MSKSIDKEILIDEVRQRPCIYDFNNKDYARLDIKNNNWHEICEILKLEGTRGLSSCYYHLFSMSSKYYYY